MLARALNIRLLGGEIFGAMGTRGEAFATTLDALMSALLCEGPFVVMQEPANLVQALPEARDQPCGAELEVSTNSNTGSAYEATIRGLGETVASALVGRVEAEEVRFIVEVTMGVLARHAGCTIEDDPDFPVRG